MLFGEYVWSPRIYVSIFLKKKAKEANEVKMCKRYERCETAWTKRTFKTKRYNQIQIYIAIIHAMKHLKHYYDSITVRQIILCVCVCV